MDPKSSSVYADEYTMVSVKDVCGSSFGSISGDAVHVCIRLALALATSSERESIDGELYILQGSSRKPPHMLQREIKVQ